MRIGIAVLVASAFVGAARAEEPPAGSAPKTDEQKTDDKGSAPTSAPSAAPATGPATAPSAAPATQQSDEELLKEIERTTGAPGASGGKGASGGAAAEGAAGTSAGADAGSAGAPGQGVGTLSTSAQSRTTGLFPNIYNPAMSVNALFLGSVSSLASPPDGAVPNALAVQELELQFLANVDPYFTANLMFSIPGGDSFGLEEGFVVPAWRPLGLELRIGRLKVPFGRESPTHTHALPFVDRSLIGTAIFTDEGFTEDGVELSWLAPLPWYAVLTAAALDGRNPGLFESPRSRQKAGFAGLKNVFELSDDATLEAGASYTAGHDDTGDLSQAAGAHLVLKWHPARAFRERELIAVVEGIWASHPNSTWLPPVPIGADPSVAGAYGYVQWRLAQRWVTAVRYDYLGMPSNRGNARRGSAILAFAPTEFSAIRAQLSAGDRPDVSHVVYEGLVQLDFTLGAHPAHAY